METTVLVWMPPVAAALSSSCAGIGSEYQRSDLEEDPPNTANGHARSMSTYRRVVIAIGGTLLFGMLAGWLHGNEGGLRAALANVIAPWLFVAIIPAWWAGSTIRGAVLGTATTMAALLGYYLALTAEMFGHLGNTHGFTHSLTVVVLANKIWFIAGLMSGPVCGAIAGYFGARLEYTWLALGLGLLMIGEAAAVFAMHNGFVPVLGARWGASDPRAYLPEVMLGLLALVAATSSTRSSKTVGAR